MFVEVEFGAGFYAPEMVGRYLDLSQQFPNETGVLAVTANSLVANGDYELGIEYADRVISLESQAGPSPQAWWVKGEALVRLDRQDEAIVMFETAIEKGSETQYALVAHKALAKIYFARADTAMADKHELAADEVEKLIADKENAD
ncbi:MAG: hypothetical protein IID32_07585 [Planctomycetes bacterium]|nr:hypothetical protein [Planctomycetota bacterium]